MNENRNEHNSISGTDAQSVKKERIIAFDFIRAVCALGIIINHYSIESRNPLLIRFFYSFPSGTGSLGYSIVTVFFILSGALLLYNHSDDQTILTFYKTRWRAIFPSFYVSYVICFFIVIVFLDRSFCLTRSVYTFPLTIIGMDGYFANAIRTWFVAGEWFIGAIIILYLLFPFIIRVYRHSSVFVYLASSILFFLFLNLNMLEQNAFRNCFSCLFSFCFGMAVSQFQLYRFKPAFLLSCFVFIFCYFCPLSINGNLLCHLSGISLFFILYVLGDLIMRHPIVSLWVRRTAAISYEIFLVQHIIIRLFLKAWFPSNTISNLFWLIATTIATILLANLVYRLKNRILR